MSVNYVLSQLKDGVANEWMREILCVSNVVLNVFCLFVLLNESIWYVYIYVYLSFNIFWTTPLSNHRHTDFYTIQTVYFIPLHCPYP